MESVIDMSQLHANTRPGAAEPSQETAREKIAAAVGAVQEAVAADAVSPHDYPGLFLELREAEVPEAFCGSIPQPGHIYGLMCLNVMRGEGEDAGKIGVGFRFFPIGKTAQQPGTGLILPDGVR